MVQINASKDVDLSGITADTTNIQSLINTLQTNINGLPGLYGGTKYRGSICSTAAIATQVLSQAGKGFGFVNAYASGSLVGSATVKVYDGTDATGTVVAESYLSAGESKQIVGYPTWFLRGCYIEITSDGSFPVCVNYSLAFSEPVTEIVSRTGNANNLFSASPDGVNVCGATMEIRNYFGISKGLIKWDLTNFAGYSTIVQAILTLTVNTEWTNQVLKIAPVLLDWTPSEVTYNSRKSGIAWNAPGLTSGMDYESTFIYNQAVALTPGQTIEIDVTALVLSWLDGTRNNNGLLIFTETNVPGDYLRMFGYVTESMRPTLQIYV